MIEAMLHLGSIRAIGWLVATLAVYALSSALFKKVNGNPFLHPLVVTALIMGGLIGLIGESVSGYQSKVSILHWLLGPATVGLAIPIHSQWQTVKHKGGALWWGILFGGVFAPLLAWAVLFASGSPITMQVTILTKSITTPLAMGTAEQIGGIPALAATFVIITGIVGAICAPLVFALCRVSLPAAQGLALGTVAHAVGSSKAIHMGEEVAAMAILGLCFNGLMTAVMLPIFFQATGLLS